MTPSDKHFEDTAGWLAKAMALSPEGAKLLGKQDLVAKMGPGAAANDCLQLVMGSIAITMKVIDHGKDPRRHAKTGELVHRAINAIYDVLGELDD